MTNSSSKENGFKRIITVFDKQTEKHIKDISIEIPDEDVPELQKKFDIDIKKDPMAIYFCYEITEKQLSFLVKYTNEKIDLNSFDYCLEAYNPNFYEKK